MNNRPVPRNQSGLSCGRSDVKPSSFSRSSFRIQHFSNGNQMSPVGSSPRARLSPRYSFTGSVPLSESSLKESTFYDERPKREDNMPKSSGLSYSITSSKELSSIEKINDPTSNSIVCAGKTHLGLYRFSSEDNSITRIHDFMTCGNGTSRGASFHTGLGKRTKRTKLSTIADVKAGFHNHKNYVAICGTSTAISVYDINKTDSMDNPVVTNLSEHTRSINSFDFNAMQTNLIISGGQDGCIKIWDLRSSRSKALNRSDVNINTASDSIRDVKWMQYQSPARSASQSDVRFGGTAGYKFASIHDSGLLLTFDLRQPNQVEKRINAHSGPGLCLNWHPYQDYISTGGRDGKCCLWYVGDNKASNEFFSNGSNSTNNIHLMTPNLATNLSVLPETTINCGFPVTKLKVRPCYERRILDSMVAMSSMAEDFGVSIYSLARKYIPKYNLSSSSPSLGIVWWDDNLIFNIDKGNRITGWYVDNEPTVLDNLPKSMSRWRDIEGNGLLFVDQDSGTYEVYDDMPINLEDIKKPNNHRISISSSNGATGNSTGMMGSIKKGISQTGLTSLSGERQNKMGPNYNGKIPPTQSVNLSHSNSVSSYPGVSLHNDLANIGNMESPYMVVLDLPYILNNMRISQLPPDKKLLNSPEALAIKESPVKVFKFLAKELEFSYMQESRAGDVKSVTQQSNTNEDTTKKDLMEKFGLSENTTWTALISKKTEATEPASKEGVSIKDTTDSLVDSDVDEDAVNEQAPMDEASSNGFSGENNKHDNNHEVNIEAQERINFLLDLIPICSHNAAVYSYIDDLPNFKIWILIRDSLLWDLKHLSSEYPEGKVTGPQETNFEQTGQRVSMGNDLCESVNSEIRSYMTSDLNSLVEEQPKALQSDPEGQKGNRKPSSNLKKQLTRIKESEILSEDKLKNNSPVSTMPEDSRKSSSPLQEQGHVSKDSESAILEDDDMENKPGPTSQVNGIPILSKREPRRSFIDTYMSGVKSSMGSNADSDMGLSKSRRSQSFGHSSPGSRMSPIASVSSAEFTFASYKKGSSRAERRSSGSMFMSPLKKDELTAPVKPPTRPHSPTVPKNSSSLSLPPWDTRKLLKQIYRQAVEMGNTLLVVNILFLFQNIYQVTTIEVVKNSLAQFISILHRYELFELSAAILKYSPWEVVVNADGSQSLIPLFCDRCGKLITNEMSKERFTLEAQREGNSQPLERMGFWYCDNCKKPNTLCVLCELPMKTLAMCLLECGHEGHFECLKSWFLDEGMTECPAGCMNHVRL